VRLIDGVMRGIAVARTAPPIALLVLLHIPVPAEALVPILLVVFFVLGALANGLTIAVIGLLMEISPDDQRPGYSGNFNALTAPAFVLPLVGGFAVAVLGTWIVFATALLAAIGQATILARMDAKE
jgi:MFS family permease